MTLGKCAATGGSVDTITNVGDGYYVMPTCKSIGKTFIETIYLNDKCSGDPISKTTINTDACVRTAGGEACAWFCE